MTHSLTFRETPEGLTSADTLVLLGRKERLVADDALALLPHDVSPALWRRLVGDDATAADGRVRVTWREAAPERLIAACLPDVVHRHNTPTRAWGVPALLAAARGAGRTAIVVLLDDPAHAPAIAAGIARAWPSWHAGRPGTPHPVEVWVQGGHAPTLQVVADAVRRAGHLVDLPPAELGPRALLAEARAAAARVGASVYTLVGAELERQGLNGLYGVGKASREPPALIVLDHAPPDATAGEVWVGKGITYDTGGLSIKTKTGMPGMKNDMAGAAAVLCAFEAAVRLGASQRLTAVLAVAENAIGPDALRPDDVLTMYSGRTVEVNNTDAEGRLVLADAVAWAAKHRAPTRILDLATLTGAQSGATGARTAAVISNDEALEAQVVAAGHRAGDVCFPLPFQPELLRREFASRVADMKNSVKDRNNAQSSCAALFIHWHLPDDALPWAHVDLAGPAFLGERGTGFGVALLLELAGVLNRPQA